LYEVQRMRTKRALQFAWNSSIPFQLCGAFERFHSEHWYNRLNATPISLHSFLLSTVYGDC
jgi:hypothetical protein